MSLGNDSESTVRTFFDAVSRKDYEKVRECLHPSYMPRRRSLLPMKHAVSMTDYPPEQINEPGPEALIKRIKLLFDGLEDFSIQIIRLIAQDDHVWVDVRVCGTHSGVVFGVPPSNNWIDYRGFLTYKIQDGKIIENDVLFDWFAMLAKLGIFGKPDEETDIEEYLTSIRRFQKLLGPDNFESS